MIQMSVFSGDITASVIRTEAYAAVIIKFFADIQNLFHAPLCVCLSNIDPHTLSVFIKSLLFRFHLMIGLRPCIYIRTETVPLHKRCMSLQIACMLFSSKQQIMYTLFSLQNSLIIHHLTQSGYTRMLKECCIILCEQFSIGRFKPRKAWNTGWKCQQHTHREIL